MSVTQSKIVFIETPFGNLTIGSIASTHTTWVIVG